MTATGRQAEFEGASARATESHVIRKASEALRSGEVVVIPTDTVYGLAAAVNRPDALSRLYALKKRPREKAIPILLSEFSQLQQVSTGLSKMAKSPRVVLLAGSADPCSSRAFTPFIAYYVNDR